MLLPLLLAAALAAGDATDGYAWPLDLPRELTSSFAEFRSGRFHAGIDLRTNGIGRDVFAARAGAVTRVRCSPHGYGKAIYLQLDDGNHLVYGHLDDFYPELRDYVRSAQHSAKQYTVDLYPDPGEFRVEKGQFIAKSGQTGIGAPHLHFELRDSANRPIDPRPFGLDWADTVAPQVRRIVVAPENDRARVDGDLKPIVLQVTRTPDGAYRTAPVTVHGSVGFGVESNDPGANGNVLGIYRMRLLVAGTEHFRMQHDRIDYEDHKNAAVSYHPYLLDEGRFLLLWRWPGNVCESYRHSEGNGWVSVPDTTEAVQIEVSDFHGNTTTVTVPIQHAASTEVETPATGADTNGVFDLEVYDDTLTVSVQFEGAETGTPELVWDGPEPGEASMLRIGKRTFRHRFAPMRSGLYNLHVNHPRVPNPDRRIAVAVAGSDTEFQLDDVTLHIPADAPYGRFFMQSLSRMPANSPLRAHGDAWRFWPALTPLCNPVSISFPAPETIGAPEKTGLYQIFSGWSLQNTERQGNRLSMKASRLGSFAILEDSQPPSVSNVLPVEGFQAQSARPGIEATLHDSGSGIDRVEIYCGEAWLLTRYDPELNHMHWEQDEDLPAGPQSLRIVVTDKSGNTNTTLRNVVIPDPKAPVPPTKDNG
ncbi:MAG: M23 family metallopeptidase [Candidatus Hydrogenedentes bacterium]|nr:M23 family metallopeptidase [Candidatus Hydrogenedentota bacterium]